MFWIGLIHNFDVWWRVAMQCNPLIHAQIQISFSGGVPPKTHSSYYMILWFPDFSGCKPYTRKVNVSTSNHEVSTFWTLFRFMTVVYINAVQYQTCPNHESDNHFFAKIPGGVRTPGPPLWIRPCYQLCPMCPVLAIKVQGAPKFEMTWIKTWRARLHAKYRSKLM